MNDSRGGMASYDYTQLTTLVLMAHYKCIRVEIQPCSPCHIKIAIWKRVREGNMSRRHPTIEEAIDDYMKRFPQTLTAPTGKENESHDSTR